MIDTKRTGKRCRAKKMIRNHTGVIAPLSQGTIRYEIENLGRELIYVQWDAGPAAYVFSDEIEILGATGPQTCVRTGRIHALNQRTTANRIHYLSRCSAQQLKVILGRRYHVKKKGQ